MANKVLENLKYTKEHEWAKLEGNIITVGITDFAQSALGDIVFVELPEVESELNQDESFGVVESVKSVSDLYVPISGRVTEVNSSLESEPELINQNAYESWLIKMDISENLNDYQNLLSAKDYEEFCKEQN